MKRAKMILTAMGVLTIVGGTLAFKARNVYQGNLRCAFTTITTTHCTLFSYSITTFGGVILACTEITAPPGIPCHPTQVTFNP